MQDTNRNLEGKNGDKEGEGRITIPFGAVYRFEGKDYTEVDITGIRGMTVQDAIDIQKKLFDTQEVAALLIAETTTAFTGEVAAKASGMPIEYFKLMPRGISKKVQKAIRGYIDSEGETESHIMRLEKPYYYEGKQYTEIDLNGVASMNAMNESEAENRIVREGFMVTENTFNYLYACVIASMATGLPEKFFTGLPIEETIKLKNAVNDGDFFM